MAAFFADIGYEALPSGNPLAALEILGNRQIDVAVVDLEMPDLSGVQFIARARELQSSLKYVVYTGSLNRSLLQELEFLGIPHDQVLEKPLTSISDMLETVQKAFYGS